jgi:hypothetical protein
MSFVQTIRLGVIIIACYTLWPSKYHDLQEIGSQRASGRRISSRSRALLIRPDQGEIIAVCAWSWPWRCRYRSPRHA